MPLSVFDLAVITPLRDGMNTANMEFVIARFRACVACDWNLGCAWFLGRVSVIVWLTVTHR